MKGGRSIPILAVIVASLGGASAATGSAMERFPNPCHLLAMAHPETALESGAALLVSHRQYFYDRISGVPTVTCSERVGGHNIVLGLSTAARGLVEVGKVRSRAWLPLLGSGATLTVYAGAQPGSLGGEVYVSEAITFHRGVAPARYPTYASILVFPPTHRSALETLARRLYGLL
jgi:hypothetical protein